MVLQKAVDNLKDRPKDEKVAVAGGIATLVVAILLAGWLVYFFKKIQRGGTQINSFGAPEQIPFNTSAVNDAQKQMLNTYNQSADQLRAIRDEAASQQLQNQQTYR